MSGVDADELEKIRKQFDFGPYPRIPVEKTPKDDNNLLFFHNLVTPYYLRYQKVIDTTGKRILDAGCGTGYKGLLLAEANPGAEIVGVDISEASVKLAEERLKFHKVENATFHTLSIYDLPDLGMEFDYINCDEVLYLLPDAVSGLEAMKSVLKPEGIIRTNLHSQLQREPFFRAQYIFQLMGLMDGNPEEMEMQVVKDIMTALKDGVDLKKRTWRPAYNEENSTELLLANHLLVGDKGSTMADVFDYLDAANLDFITMVNWRHWSFVDLFQDQKNLPSFLAMSLPDVPDRLQLQLYELFHPVHRLLDVWCGHPQELPEFTPLEEWTDADWQGVRIHFHPQLRTEKVKEKWLTYLGDRLMVDLGAFFSISSNSPVYIDPHALACLLPLFDGPMMFNDLGDRWQQLAPLDPLTLEPLSRQAIETSLQKLLSRLEPSLFVLLERA